MEYGINGGGAGAEGVLCKGYLVREPGTDHVVDFWGDGEQFGGSVGDLFSGGGTGRRICSLIGLGNTGGVGVGWDKRRRRVSFAVVGVGGGNGREIRITYAADKSY